MTNTKGEIVKYELELSEQCIATLLSVAAQFGTNQSNLSETEMLEVGIDILAASYDAQFDDSPGLPTSEPVSRDELRQAIERVTDPSIAFDGDIEIHTPQGKLDLGEK